MSRSAVLGAVMTAAWLLSGCGSAQEPRDEDIYYTSSLRPGRVPPESQGERELLARIEQVPSDEPVSLGGQVFLVGAPYPAASGRLCRSVAVRAADGAETAEVKLACEDIDGGAWVFVPDVFAPSPVAEQSAVAGATTEESAP